MSQIQINRDVSSVVLTVVGDDIKRLSRILWTVMGNSLYLTLEERRWAGQIYNIIHKKRWESEDVELDKPDSGD